MATNIFKFDGTLLTQVADGTVDASHASIKIPGKSYQPYGETVMEGLIWILENFGGLTAPENPLVGQLWYDTTILLLKVWNGSAWATTGGVISQATAPTSGNSPGSLWYDTINQQLNIWNGSSWLLVGPEGSAVNTDPIATSVPTHSVIDAVLLIDAGGTSHQVWRLVIGGTLFAIISKDAAFLPNPVVSGFTGIANDNKIYPGINFKSTVSGTTIIGDSTLFKSNQNNLPDSDNTRNLGSTSQRFANIYSNRAQFNQLGINTAPTSNQLAVSGKSLFSGPVTIGGGTANAAPMTYQIGTLTATPQLGAVEFDGVDFYFTNSSGGTPIRQVPLYSADATVSNRLYVSTAGNDANNGTVNKPYRTIKAALAAVAAGDTIILASGDYTEANPLYVPARVSIVGDNLRRVTVRPLYPQLDVFHTDSATYFYGFTVRDHQAPAAAVAFRCAIGLPTMSGNLVTGSGIVSSISAAWSPGSYSVAPAVFIEPPVDLTGVQATATANLVTGIQVVTVTSGGSGYTSPTATASGSTTSDDAVLTVRTVGGVITAINVVTPGSGYTTGTGAFVTISDVTGVGATAIATVVANIIGSFTITNSGSKYSFVPTVSVPPPTPLTITVSPYIQNCSSITGPYDTTGKLITTLPPYNISAPGSGFTAVNPNGAGSGTRIDGQVLSNVSVITSMVCDSYTQINQGGIGHLIINKGYAQFVSCFTTFSSVGFWARSGGVANISNSVVDFGTQGIRASGYYPVAYASGTVANTYNSTVAGVRIDVAGSGYSANFPVSFSGGGGSGASGNAIVNLGGVSTVQMNTSGSNYTSVPSVSFAAGSGTSATGTVILQSPNVLRISGLSNKPQNGTSALINSVFYNVIAATLVSGTTYDVQIQPAIVSVSSGTTVAFYNVSYISTGSLALEYPGSGVTFNALPAYGGVPDLTQKTISDYPGKVYYVTIDNTGNFSVGPYFGVDFATGTITLNANNINLSGISEIGPFSRNGVVAGVQLQEVSDDPSLTHVNASYDHTTAPTQYAVKGYITGKTIALAGAVSGSASISSSDTTSIVTTANSPVLRNVTAGYTSGGQVFITGSTPTASAAGDIWINTSGSGGGAQSLTSNGYVTLPGGGIIQWGQGTTDGGGNGTITFPITFPNNVFSVTVTCNTSGAMASIQYFGLTTSGCGVQTHYAQTSSYGLRPYTYIAVGY